MARDMMGLRTIILVLLLGTYAASLTVSGREKRHVGSQESSHRPGGIQEAGSHSLKSSTSKNNEITAEPGRKVSHRLIGGHLRVSTEREPFWDDGILMSSAGNGKEGRPTRGEEDDEKKTLSQQVKEGKYGLIQNELHGKRPKRPGIISYLGNPEVPKDTIDTLGGLDEEEIWLAENHVLVLRGGNFPGHEATQTGEATTWPPIDNYKAPRRQVKIPARPKVPPPFPVQLSEGGPIQILGTNGSKEIANGTVDYRQDPIFTKGLLPGEGPLFTSISNGTLVNPETNGNVDEKEKEADRKTDSPPVFYHAIPPGAVFVPPPVNQTDYEEDDQSIYYPPPYSFQYQQDNTTAVPPGPLVPGIILPPPPDFFSALDEKKTTTKKYTKRPATTTAPRPRPTYLPPRKLTTRYKTSTSTTVETRTSSTPPASTKMFTRTVYRNVTSPTTVKTVPYVEITTPTPDRSTTLNNLHYNLKPTIHQVSESNSRERSRTWTELATSKTVPVVAYYPSTTQASIERPVEVTPATIKNIVTTPSSENAANHASYYFYEENTATTPSTTTYQRTTTESPSYYNQETTPRPRVSEKQYYSVETVPSEQTKDFTVKILDLVKSPEVVDYGQPETTSTTNDRTRSQGQRMLDRGPVYYQTISSRPHVQAYYTTPKPQTYYRPNVQPKPVYQYSFEAADYSRRTGSQRNQYRQQQIGFNEYQNEKNQRYEYEDSRQPLRSNGIPFKSQPYYPSSTARPIISTTPNPHQSLFTQQDETLLDDVTKEYFTIFGQKLSGKGVSSTTPLYGKVNSVTEKPNYNPYVQTIPNNYHSRPPVYNTPNVRVHYGDQEKPYSLKEDIRVNYKQQVPRVQPYLEFIPKQQPPSRERYTVPSKEYRPEDGTRRFTPVQDYTQQIEQGNVPPSYVPLGSPEELDETYQDTPLSLADDIEVNYRDPLPTINPDAELFDPAALIQARRSNLQEKPSAQFAYRFPGDAGHFYFLTPQAITQRPEQSDGYLYPKSRAARLLRKRRQPGSV